MSDNDGSKDRSSRKKPVQTKRKANIRWTTVIILWTFIISGSLSFLTSVYLPHVGWLFALFFILLFIALGIGFDILGIAVTASSETRFHSMAAKRVAGATEALALIRSAEKVSNFCNDVVGDISGILCGSAATVLMTNLTFALHAEDNDNLGAAIGIIITALVSAFTVGGKSVGKGVAMKNAEDILFLAGRVIHIFKRSDKR